MVKIKHKTGFTDGNIDYVKVYRNSFITVNKDGTESTAFWSAEFVFDCIFEHKTLYVEVTK